MSGCTRTRQLLNLVGLMERLVVLRLEYADLSRKFSSSFVLRDLVDAGEASAQLLAPYGGSSPRNRSSARVLEECINIRFGATVAPYIRPLAPFLFLQKTPPGACLHACHPGKFTR